MSSESYPVIGASALTIFSMVVSLTCSAVEPGPVVVAASGPVFAHPHDLTLDPAGRFLYVADLGNDAVRVLDPDSLEVLATIGEGELNSPHDVAFAGPGQLLVADSGNDRIAVYRIDGTKAEYQGELKGNFASPEGVTTDGPDAVYVTNVGFHNVVRIHDGDRTRVAGRLGSGRGEFSRPHDIEIGPDGTLYVADPGNNRIQLLSRDLKVVGAIAGPVYDFNEPKYLALDENGWVFVADQYNNQIQILDGDRNVVATIGKNSEGAARVELDRPEGVEVRGAKIWVADTYNNRIVLFQWTR